MLTELQIRNAKPKANNYMLTDNKGLGLLVHKNGSKYWVHRFIWQGKRVPMHIGSYPIVSLTNARELHFQNRVDINNGIDPRSKNKKSECRAYTFEEFGEIWFKKYQTNKSKSTVSKVRGRLDNDLYPFVGNKLLTELNPQDFRFALDKCIERGVIDTAHRILRHARAILDDALTLELIDRNVCDRLVKILPPIKKQHFAAVVTPKEFGLLLRQIDGYRGNIVAEYAFKLMPLLFVRHHELRSMKWSDIDLDKSEWRFLITKTETEHIVPLSSQAVKLLIELRHFTGKSEYAFASDVSTTGYISDNTLLSALRRLGISKEMMTIHGFRAAARTLIHEELNFDPNIIEHQLGHEVPDLLGKAYNRTKFIKQRKTMMQAWADYCDKIKSND